MMQMVGLVLLLMAVVEGMYNTVVQDDQTLLRKSAFAIATRGLHEYGRLVMLAAAIVLVLSTLVKHRARGLEFVPSSTEPMRFIFGSVALLWLIIDAQNSPPSHSLCRRVAQNHSQPI